MIEFVAQKISEDKHWFKFVNVKIREFRGEILLTTTEDTVCTSVELDQPASPTADQISTEQLHTSLPDRYEKVKAAKIDLMDYTAYYSCQNCFKRLSDVDTEPHQQCVCGAYQRIEDCEKTVKIRIKINKQDQWLTMFDDALKEFSDNTNRD